MINPFTGIPPHLIFFWNWRYLSDSVVSKMIQDLDGRQRLDGFNQNRIRYLLQGFQYEIMNEIGG